MGNQLRMVVVSLLIVLSLPLFAQKQKNVADAKGYLFYYCIKDQYNIIDSNGNNPSNRDYSGSYYVQMSDLPLQVLDNLQLYYKSKINNFMGAPQESSYDSLANMVCWSCFRFIEAKETRKYLKKIVKSQLLVR